jgi:hypothetical protein
MRVHDWRLIVQRLGVRRPQHGIDIGSRITLEQAPEGGREIGPARHAHPDGASHQRRAGVASDTG